MHIDQGEGHRLFRTSSYTTTHRLSLNFGGVALTVLELCPFINGKIAEFSISVLLLKFASTECCKTYTQYLIPQNSDQF